MNYTFEIVDNDREITITFKNLSIELLNELTKENNIIEICKSKFYMYGVYDKVKFLNHDFMILKSSKKNIILLSIF